MGTLVTVQVEGLSHRGEGVARHEGLAVFIPGAAPGDTVRAQFSEIKPTYARADLRAVVAPSPHRAAPPCADHADCGACQLQHIAYPEQVRLKTVMVRETLRRLGQITADVHPCLPAGSPLGYRNKAQYPVGGRKGALTGGCYAAGTHRIVPVDHCHIQHPVNDAILRAALALGSAAGLVPYNEVTGEGFLRHIIARVAVASGEAACVLVTNAEAFPGGPEFARVLRREVPALVGVLQNVNTARGNAIVGGDTRVLAGRDTIREELGGLKFEVSPLSFFQTNPAQAEVLYDLVAELAAVDDEDALDLYCGTGTIALYLARRAKQVYGVERDPGAVADAKRNAALNGIANASFVAGDASKLMPQLARGGWRPRAVVLDPPRKGAEPSVLHAIAELGPERVVYVSCNPATLARDLAIMAGLGYHTSEVRPVDMFPQTAHVECCALLVRGDK
ncbi:MAG: 23S rRNA (uracil(1939)-C(5))-methyltransferase RlmD [Bacillota bacterium]